MSFICLHADRNDTSVKCTVQIYKMQVDPIIFEIYANICDAFNDRYSPVLLIVFSCSPIDLTAENSLRRDVAAPSLKTIKAGRLQFLNYTCMR